MTDRIDTEGPLRVLAAYRAGDSQICSMVWVSTLDEEDGKRVDREREYLVQGWTRIENGCRRFSRPRAFVHDRHCKTGCESSRGSTGDGRKLPPPLAAEINRLRRRLGLVLDLVRDVDAERYEVLAATPEDAVVYKITAVWSICGIGTILQLFYLHSAGWVLTASRRLSRAGGH